VPDRTCPNAYVLWFDRGIVGDTVSDRVPCVCGRTLVVPSREPRPIPDLGSTATRGFERLYYVMQVNQVTNAPDAILADPVPGNEQFPWDSFDSKWYLDHNYRTLRDDDRQILRRLGEFFNKVDRDRLSHAVDVGTGSNLYPLLAVLPLCGRVTLWERAKTNCDWLRREIAKYSEVWDPYWEELSRWPLYQPMQDPRWSVSERTKVERGSVFNLPRDAFDLGTMFFVAESITERAGEFERAMRCFLRSLRPNAPFAAAFMLQSSGYQVNGVHFPAVAITKDHVQECLSLEGARRATLAEIKTETPLRDGVGMMLVTGWSRGR
jgi:NNMT/PNMT/TEMT family protein